MEDETSDDHSYLSGSSSSDSLTNSTTTDDSDDELRWDSDNSRPPGPSPPSSANMNESPAISQRERRIRGRRPRRLAYTESDPQTDDELTVSMVSSASDSNPPSPTVSTFMIHENTDSVSDEDSDVTTMVSSPSSPARSPSRSSIVTIPSDNHESVNFSDLATPNNQSEESENEGPPGLEPNPQHLDILPPNPPVEVPAADIPQVVNETAAIPPQEASEPVLENGETVNKPEPPCSRVTPAVLNSPCFSETDENSLCTICMDPLTNSGNHRVVCLRCGHIFGHSCLERWIKIGCNTGAKRCPTCNKKACLKDIRILFLPKVVPLDTVEKDRLVKEKEELIAQKNVLEMELSKCKLQKQLSVRKFEDKLAQLEKELSEAKKNLKNFMHIPCKEDSKVNKDLTIVELLYSVDLCKEGGCRVLAYNPILHELVVSQPSGNTLFAGFGVRVLNSVDFQPSRYVFLHSKMIRDLAFHPEDRDMLLSVSLDQTAKLVDLASSTIVHTFKGEGALWSCCWDASNPHLMLVGSQLGKVCQYDRRMTDKCVNIWSTANNMTPVVSLASVPSVAQTPFPQGGFLSCRLNGLFAYARHRNMYNCQELKLSGPFMSMRYDSISQNLITSARPSSSCPYVRISLNLVDADEIGNVCLPEIHTFNCGSSARFLSRLTTVPTRNDSIIIAHHESGRSLNTWSSKTGNLLQSIPTREPVIDLANMYVNNNSKCLFASLSEKKVFIYKVT